MMSKGQPTARAHTRWAEIGVGDELPELIFEVTPLAAALVPVASWDLFPGHHVRSFAQAQGQPDVYLNTIALQGLTDRCVIDHVPLGAFIARRKFGMRTSAHPGDVLRGRAVVTAVQPSDTGPTVDFSVTLRSARGVVVEAELTVAASPPPPHRTDSTTLEVNP